MARYAEDAPGAGGPAGGLCAGVLSGASEPLSCTEPCSLRAGGLYTATPLLYSWTGGEKRRSPSAVIAPDAPASVTLTNGGGPAVRTSPPETRPDLLRVVLAATALSTDTVTLTLASGSPTVSRTPPASTAAARCLHRRRCLASRTARSPSRLGSASSYGDTSAPTTITRTKDTTGPTSYRSRCGTTTRTARSTACRHLLGDARGLQRRDCPLDASERALGRQP